MFFDWGTPFRHFDDLLRGAGTTLWITVLTFIISSIAGTFLALARLNREHKVLYFLSSVYVELIRNTPVLVQIFFIYFGLPQFGILLPPLTAGLIALSINNSAYIAEIMRSGIKSTHKGQWEAASSLGLTSFRIFRLVILPQALRNIFPALTNQFIMILFGTSLLSILDVRELTQRASILNSETFRTMEIFIVVTMMYYVISIFSSIVLKWINRRFFPSTSK
ncbi:MAG: amino acid ABC transporter permease [Paenibacillaceae bacterium]